MSSKGTLSSKDSFTFMREFDWIKTHAKNPEPPTPGNIFIGLMRGYKEGYKKSYGQALAGEVEEPETFRESMHESMQPFGAIRYEIQRIQKQREVLQTQIYGNTLKSKVLHKAHDLLFKAFDHTEIPQNQRYNDWRIKFDDGFAQAYYSSLPTFVPANGTQCCNFCRNMLLGQGRKGDSSISVSLDEYIEIARFCSICQLILRASVHTVDDQGILRLACSNTSIRSVPQGQRLLRFGAIAGLTSNSGQQMPIGQPVLQDRDCTARFHLLRAWLRRCDETHRCKKSRISTKSFPTRVLDVGDPNGFSSESGRLRLINAMERENDAYVAVSHCWGQLTDAQKRTFCTTTHNLDQRHYGFHISDLPRTFQDAVKVARAVGVRYLWIDSLCIIQYGDNQKDWESEALRMKDVYSGAYFTIAATAATNSYSGFLDRNEFTEYTCVECHHTKFFISTDVGDFDHDVVEAPLNSRAWVFQETVLSRRTVHFSSTQMYWECGVGVNCENQTMLTCLPTDRFFLMDPVFPARILQHLQSNTVKAFEYSLIPVIEEYSKRQLTFAKDRPIAIAGLEERIVETFNSESKFGVLEKYLHYSLLWKPAGNKVASVEHVMVMDVLPWCGEFSTRPSISCFENMAEQIHGASKNYENQLSADLATITGCTIYKREPGYLPGLVPGMDFVLQRTNSQKAGIITFDTTNPPAVHSALCIVVARIRGKYLVGIDENFYACLLVVPAGENTTYRRIGMGFVQTDCVHKLQENVRME